MTETDQQVTTQHMRVVMRNREESYGIDEMQRTFAGLEALLTLAALTPEDVARIYELRRRSEIKKNRDPLRLFTVSESGWSVMNGPHPRSRFRITSVNYNSPLEISVLISDIAEHGVVYGGIVTSGGIAFGLVRLARNVATLRVSWARAKAEAARANSDVAYEQYRATVYHSMISELFQDRAIEEYDEILPPDLGSYAAEILDLDAAVDFIAEVDRIETQ